MNEKLKFGELCAKALSEEYEQKLALCNEKAVCTTGHYKKISKIIGEKVGKYRRLSIRLTAALIAILTLLLVGCTAYIYKEEIKGFIIEINEKYSKIKPDDTDINGENDLVFGLNYVPAGYEKTEESVKRYLVYYKYQSGNEKYMSFSQYLRSSSRFTVDRELSQSEVLYIGGNEVYYSYSESVYFYIFSKDKYAIVISSNSDLRNEITEIINGIIEK